MNGSRQYSSCRRPCFRLRRSASACRVRYSASDPSLIRSTQDGVAGKFSPINADDHLGLASQRYHALEQTRNPCHRRARYRQLGTPECSRRSPAYESGGRRPVDRRRTSDRRASAELPWAPLIPGLFCRRPLRTVGTPCEAGRCRVASFAWLIRMLDNAGAAGASGVHRVR